MKLSEIQEELQIKKINSYSRSNSKSNNQSFSLWEENETKDLDNDKLFEELDRMYVP